MRLFLDSTYRVVDFVQWLPSLPFGPGLSFVFSVVAASAQAPSPCWGWEWGIPLVFLLWLILLAPQVEGHEDGRNQPTEVGI